MASKKYDWPEVKYHSAEWWRLYRAANIEKLRAYHREYDRKSYRIYPQEEQARRKRWAEANREKTRAHGRLHYAIKVGKIIPQPCQVCGDRAGGHHEDYSKPLDVIWLCGLHHKARHMQIS